MICFDALNMKHRSTIVNGLVYCWPSDRRRQKRVAREILALKPVKVKGFLILSCTRECESGVKSTLHWLILFLSVHFIFILWNDLLLSL